MPSVTSHWVALNWAGHRRLIKHFHLDNVISRNSMRELRVDMLSWDRQSGWVESLKRIFFSILSFLCVPRHSALTLFFPPKKILFVCLNFSIFFFFLKSLLLFVSACLCWSSIDVQSIIPNESFCQLQINFYVDKVAHKVR